MPGAVLAGVALLSWLLSGQSESFRLAQHFIQNDPTYAPAGKHQFD